MKPPEYFNFARDVVEPWARERPNELALWCVGEDAHEDKFSFEQLVAAGRRAAHFFHTLGLKPGDRVLVILPRVPQWWIGMLGLVRLGAVPIPGTPMLTTADLRYRMEAAGVKAIITDSDGAAKVENFDGVRLLVGGQRAGWTNFDEGVRGASPDFEPELTRSDDP
ncbi:MAG TPA: AMP-binding protein, partial [Verrucomicrobiae bacterium]|nr:AMP-binding protein [Verrucomicrobiae bacterium]